MRTRGPPCPQGGLTSRRMACGAWTTSNSVGREDPARVRGSEAARRALRVESRRFPVTFGYIMGGRGVCQGTSSLGRPLPSFRPPASVARTPIWGGLDRPLNIGVGGGQIVYTNLTNLGDHAFSCDFPDFTIQFRPQIRRSDLGIPSVTPANCAQFATPKPALEKAFFGGDKKSTF